MHDGEDAGAFEIGLFLFHVIGKQPPYIGMALVETGRRARRYDGIDLARRQHVLEGRALGDRLQLQPLGRHEFGPLAATRLSQAAPAPADIGGLNAVIVLEDAAHPGHRRHLVFRRADDLALEVLGLLDPRTGVDENPRMAELAAGKDRDADIGALALGGQRYEVRKGQLGDVEFLVVERPVEHLLGLELEHGGPAAFDGGAAVDERPGSVGIANGDGDVQRHGTGPP